MIQAIKNLSERDIPLVYQGGPGEVPILTVENYIKWYSIYAVMPDGKIATPDQLNIDHEILADSLGGMVGWFDHVPNPVFCERAAEKLGYEWDENSLDMIWGRWMQEVDEKYCAALLAAYPYVGDV